LSSIRLQHSGSMERLGGTQGDGGGGGQGPGGPYGWSKVLCDHDLLGGRKARGREEGICSHVQELAHHRALETLATSHMTGAALSLTLVPSGRCISKPSWP